MLMSTLDGVEAFPAYPELAGKRVLITGLSRTHGVDIARAFAEHRTRLVLQVAEDCAEMQAVAEIAAQSALEMRLFTGPCSMPTRPSASRARRSKVSPGSMWSSTSPTARAW